MTDPLLSIFPPPLLTRILCGGEGLREAYGPVAPIGSAAPPWTLIHIEGRPVAMYPGWPALHLTALPALWRLPLDHWRARLALVAAHLVLKMPLRERPPVPTSAVVIVQGDHVSLIGLGPASLTWSGPFATLNVLSHTWTRSGRPAEPCLYLPTLPAHLRDHDSDVALVLALYDVPEIRARLT